MISIILFGTIPQISSLDTSDCDNYWSRNIVGDRADAFFDDSLVHEIRLFFDDPNWYDTLNEAHSNDPENPYFPARFFYNNTELNPIGVRFKGFSSFRVPGIKKPFQIDFNEYQEDDPNKEEITFFGLKKLNLNNGFKDPSMLVEKLFWDFASKYVTSIRAVHTRLFINDEYYGLYTAVEQIDHTFIESRFGNNENGNLYKVEVGTLTNIGMDQESYIGPYELKTNLEENNYSDLVDLTYVLTNTSLAELPEKFEEIFDVKSGLNALALLNLFSSLDSYLSSGRNYYLYNRDDTGQFNFLLWDANEAFGAFTMGLAQGEDLVSLDPFWSPSPGSGGPPLDGFPPPPGGIPPDGLPPPPPPGGIPPDGLPPPPPPGGGLFASGEQPLMTNLMEIDSYNRTYLRLIAKMVREGFNREAFIDRIQELADLIRDDVYNDPNLLFSPQDFEARVLDLVNFVEERAAFLNPRLDELALKSDLKLNDLMSVNLDTIADSEGEYLPWIEIYNAGPGLVTTDNVFLSDNQNTPNKWKMPTKDLDDGQFLLLWLDGQSSKGSDYASFSLNLSGGEVFMYVYENSNYNLIDNVTYPALGADVSYGRIHDGEAIWSEMNDNLTPALANMVDDLPGYLFINEFMADNDITYMTSDGTTPDWIELYNSGFERVDLSGMYLTDDLTDSKGWQFPEGSFIEPGDYFVVWADGTSNQESFHTNFKLNANGEEIGLFANDGETLIDSIVFLKQIRDVSYGRIPDGTSNWDYLSTSSLGFSNEKTSTEMESSYLIILLLISLVFIAGILLIFSNKIRWRGKQR